MGIKMIETLTGKPFNLEGGGYKAPTESFITKQTPENNAGDQTDASTVESESPITAQEPKPE
jgi:hypothetical protein